MDDKTQEIEELRDEIDRITAERKKDREEFEARITALEKTLNNHGHAGDDGSKRLEREIDLLSGQSIGVGGVSALTGFAEKTATSERTLVVIGTGKDTNAKDGLANSQIYMEHQQTTDGSTNQTFFQGIRAPIFVGTSANVVSGASTMRQSDYVWTTDELAGAYVAVNNSAGTDIECFVIASNTENTITVTGGTWSFSGDKLSFTVFVPIYNGSATFPWRRAYIMDGTAGGLRMGPGATNGGQNGLLYMDSSVGNGGIAWRNMSGTTVAWYAGSGAPTFAATKGSLYSRTDGSSTSTRMYINTDGSTGWTNFTTAT